MVLGMGIVLTDVAFVTCEVIVVECLHFFTSRSKSFVFTHPSSFYLFAMQENFYSERHLSRASEANSLS